MCIFRWGDNSLATAKANALASANVKGLVDVSVDVESSFYIINENSASDAESASQAKPPQQAETPRQHAAELTSSAAAAARKGECLTVKELAVQVRELDVDIYNTEFVLDVAISDCLGPAANSPQATSPEPAKR